MKESFKLKGLSLKVGPLGENDRLLTLLSDQKGISRLAVPGARRPKSSLAATAPLTFLELQIGGKSKLKKVRQIKIIKSFCKLGETLEALAAAQILAELSILLVGVDDPQQGILETILFHLDRLEKDRTDPSFVLANCVQSCVHLLTLGGYSLPIQKCCISGDTLIPPIGNWEWECSFLPTEGFAIGSIDYATIKLNASELALLQRLIKPDLPKKKNGDILGPVNVWEKLLLIVENWIEVQLSNKPNALNILKSTFISNNFT